jgi:hypothetical protein
MEVLIHIFLTSALDGDDLSTSSPGRFVSDTYWLASQDSSVVERWATGWMIEGWSPGRGWEFFSSPSRPDRLCRPPSLLSNGYKGFFLWEQSCRNVKLTTHLQLVPMLMRGDISPLPQYAFMARCSVKCTRTNLPLLYLTYCTAGCVGTRVGMDAVTKKKIPPLTPAGN